MYHAQCACYVLCLTCLTSILSISDSSVSQCLTCLTCHMIFLSFINLITFVSFLDFLFQEAFFIMSKHHLNHFSLTQFILAEDVQMSFSCNHCIRQRKFYVIFNKFNKCSECVCLKKSCLLFSDFLIMNVA